MEEWLVDRAFERFALEIPARTTISATPGPSGLDGQLRVLGGGGMKFESAGVIPEGTPVTMTLWTRWGSFTLAGRVVWRRPLNGEIAYGVQLDVPIGNARARELYEEVSSEG